MVTQSDSPNIPILAFGRGTYVISDQLPVFLVQLASLQLDSLFDAIIVSAEVGAEKPNPVIFEAACSQLGLDPYDTVHVGDDRR
jgi:HAD superfamily hydrolase (TIGR01549 family)